ETFLKACQLVREAVPDVRILIVGEGTQREKLERLAAELSIASAGSFLGARDDIKELLSAMDVFVLTSPTESFPNAVLEAMAAGCPVVATSVGGVPEIVGEGDAGFLVPPGDVTAVSDRVLRLLNDPALRRAMGERGAQRAQDEFSVETVSRELG